MFFEVFSALCEKSGLSPSRASSEIGFSKGSVSYWRKKYKAGENAQPDSYTAQKIADYFGVSVDYLLGRSEPPISTSPSTWIPVLGRVQAGIPMDAVEEIIGYEEISETMARQGEYFALQVRGQSMEPRILEGDVVIVQKQEDADTGDIAVVLVNGDEATIKRIKKRPEGLMLIPLNPAFEPLFYSAEDVAQLPVRIIGKVVELRGKF